MHPHPKCPHGWCGGDRVSFMAASIPLGEPRETPRVGRRLTICAATSGSRWQMYLGQQVSSHLLTENLSGFRVTTTERQLRASQ